ncbi:hypothetical protein KOI35_03705 [Actinoplanes bogorensis]|uniref:PE-PGRS family protein n=1 Tax=Paractinoplanes bogorensis TaxID=1610840 RepID=A0ABS5YGU5_9ACTN|nr:hypothetical protein [Actinoplanes bogorensis]MBU2662603.1 hypothetical protein [Actinoplanes bogorensis]
MEFDRSIGRDELFAQQSERMRRVLAASDMPVFGLAEGLRPAEETFGSLDSTDDRLVAVRLTYGRAAEVETARAEPGPLRETLEHHVRRGGDRFADLEWTEGPATLRVDGHPVAARMLRAGDRWWIVRADRDGVGITVVGRDWHPGEPAVETVTDPIPMLDRRRTPPDYVHHEPEPLPADLAREPHRALAEAALAEAAEQRRWMAEGGPEPALPGYWTTLWAAAVQRQTELSDAPATDAEPAVSAMISELGTLHHEAAWFRDDPVLRRRAVAETLLHGTGLGPDVPSRPAHEAWQRGSSSPEWRAAWAAWAQTP